MPCAMCAPDRQAEFTAEINLRFPGLEHLNNPGVLVFPKVLICLDCGLARFVTSEAELGQLVSGTSTGDTPIVQQPQLRSRSVRQGCN